MSEQLKSGQVQIKAKVKYPVAKVADFKDKEIVTVKGMEIGIYEVAGKYYAWRNVCPHAAAPVCAGKVTGTRLPSDVYEYICGRDREILRCPWHGWEFDLLTGKHLVDETVKLRGFEVVIEEEEICVLV
jgi:nitrite reductase/ring-hydroxylating ferredoxin subunit